MGAQTEPMLFLLLGWGEGIKRRRYEREVGNAASQRPAQERPAFRNVIR